MFRRILASTAVATIVIATPVSSQQSPPASEQGKRIEAMVNKAAALVESQGKAAFAEFRKRDSEWWFGNTYVFAYDQTSNVLLNSAFPKREGTNPHGEKDADGKAFHDEFLKVAQTKGSGWVDYMFPQARADSTLPEMELCERSEGRGNAGNHRCRLLPRVVDGTRARILKNAA